MDVINLELFHNSTEIAILASSAYTPINKKPTLSQSKYDPSLKCSKPNLIAKVHQKLPFKLKKNLKGTWE